MFLAFVAVAASATAQEAGNATYRVLERGRPIGTVSMMTTRNESGWRVESTSRMAGSIDLDVRRFEADYDRAWRTRFLSMELARGSASRVVHVAVGTLRAQTDSVMNGEARFGTHRTSPGTIALPDFVFGACVALAARLKDAVPGMELPLLLSPRGEVTAGVDAVRMEEMRTETGPIDARRVALLVYRDEPTPIEIWIADGRLLRVDLPLDDISVQRDDLTN